MKKILLFALIMSVQNLIAQNGAYRATNTPDFFIDDSGLKTGMNALANLVLDYMEMGKK